MKNDCSDISKREVKAWMMKLIGANRSVGLVDSETFERDLNGRFILFCVRKKDFTVILNIKNWGFLANFIWNRFIMKFKLLKLSKTINKYVCFVEA